ncbi:cilia- and flagella-associated protein 65-like isoform X2 [Periplaneta americana]|uniref:cilia- and flagella-associated protein 65-like isoform X2 n=1 Tax=Periplaneta americana TaxID=6978 RepID=UPI0037E91780
MQGVITEGYQIIVVQLCPSENSETAYVERWGLQFNGSSKYETNVDIRAYAEYPSLHFGKMNRIVFPAIYPGCEETVNVSVRNPTRHCLRYHYQQSTIPDNLDILDKVYVIASNEIISNTWKYTPQEPGEFSLQLKCEASVLQDCKYIVGMPYETSVKVNGICEYVELVAFPEKIDFGISSWGESRTQSFYLFNFGNCKMHYKLKVVHYTFPRSSKRLRDVLLSPLTSTLGPNEKNEIQVTICPSELGFNEFAVMYDIRVSSNSEATVPTVTDKILTVIQYEGVFPTLKICDLRIVQGGPIFCKLWLWKMLNINKLNDTLAEVPPDCMLDVPITLPEAQEGSKPLTVCLLLKNNSEIPNKWKIKRQQVCTCPLVNLTRGISFRYKEYDCPHRPLFQIYPTSGELQVFWIYNSLETEMPYKIDISSITVFNNSNYDVEVLKCQNPKGDIPPKSNHPILFRFCPLELKRYEISCLLRLGYTWMSFITAGMGSVKYDSHIFSMRDKMPESRNIILPEDPILLSVENIIINPIATFSRVKRIFFIENTSDYYVFEYQWFRYQIPGVLEAIVTTSKNSLHPRHSHVCTLTVTTYGYPCLLSFPIKCQILNITERRNHEKSLLVRSAVDNYLQGQFDITERGEAVPVVNVPIVPAPKPFFVVMSVTTSIRSSKTLDETLPLKIQMRQTPNQEYMHSIIETQLRLRPPDVHIIVSILEKMIWEVVYSKWFNNMVHQICEEGTPYYSQFVMEEEERCLLNKMSYCQPSRRLIESVLNDIIIDLLHTEFELGPVKKNESKFDLRKTVRKSDGPLSDDTESHISKRLSDEKIKVPSGW